MMIDRVNSDHQFKNVITKPIDVAIEHSIGTKIELIELKISELKMLSNKI